ncbi:MFS transporter [Paenibacillus tyrfis]|uniref:MFS transporter n=1 Tax=Paenibacillus tyrfis TaxID=1501230 RepID=UPI00068D82E8|nr:MFS transporter [Paenibacillus tyrfis]
MLQGLSTGVRRFVASEALFGLGVGLFSLVLNLHLLFKGVSEEQIGQITSVSTLVAGIIAIPGGLLAGKLGRKKVLVAGISLMAAGYAMFAASTALWLFYAAQALQSIGFTLIITSETQLLFHYCHSKREETQAYSLLMAVFMLFSVFGTLLGGYLSRSAAEVSTGYELQLWLATLAIALLAIVRGRLLPAEKHDSDKREAAVEAPNTTTFFTKKEFRSRYLKSGLPSKQVWFLSGFVLLSGLMTSVTLPFLNVIVKFRLDWSDESVSMLLAANGLILFVGSLMVPSIVTRFGTSKAYLILFGVNILFALVLFAALPASMFALMLLLRGGMFTMLNNLIESHSMSMVAEPQRNLFAGIRSVLLLIGLDTFCSARITGCLS